jgi:insertion element IS1 protein InsB
MIQVTITYHCCVCGSTNIVRNGTNKCGSPQYHCKDCKAYRVLEPKRTHEKDEKAMILRAYKERASMRGLERVFHVTRQTVARWIQEIVPTLPDLKDTLLPAAPDDVLELDELWSFVLKKDRNRWLWTALCRRTRQIVAFVIGDRSQKTCRHMVTKWYITEYNLAISLTM